MSHPNTTRRLILSALLGLLTLGGCRQGAGDYQATIRRTPHGIPHITAPDLASLGFGEGYAAAEDHLCSIADQVVRARGERAKYFGAGPDSSLVDADLGIRALQLYERASDDMTNSPVEARGWLEGYVAGYNQYLSETGAAAVAGWCRGQPWVRPITIEDLAAYQRLVTVLTAGFFADTIGTTQPPGPEEAPEEAPVEANVAQIFDASQLPDRELLGASNGWAIGRELSERGGGMLIANPHYPWVGSNRFWEKHLTIPGELDVYGVSLLGIPGVSIGFNEAVGWTHTVSAGVRYTLYSLELVPGAPTRYLYDGEERPMTAREVTAEVLQDDGSSAQVSRTIWFSHYGPIVELEGLAWTHEHAYALRDANDDNQEGRMQWLAMDRASSMEAFQKAHADYQGLPWVNTIAASKDGIAWYADTASTPHLSAGALQAWAERRESDATTRAVWESGIVLLDGSDSQFEWVDDPRARDPGLIAFPDMPQLETPRYAFNANDSFWMPSSRELIAGDYSAMHGAQRTARSLRTRNNDLTLSNRSPDQPAGEDGRFSLDEMAAAVLSNRSLAAELLREELVARCQERSSATIDGERVDLAEACAILSGWDNRLELDSQGAVLFREWIGQFAPADLLRAGALFAVDFDADDPVGTPRSLAPGPLALENLARAVRLLTEQKLPLDVTLRDLQYAPSKLPQRIPIHGGHGAYEGVLNMQQASTNTTTLEPLELAEGVEGSRFLTAAGYPIVHGSSFLMALELTEDGPKARAFLTYSQSGDPSSPYFTDQTRLFSEKQWRPILFRDDAIAAATEREYTVEGPREP
jgi:acyl-homoserine-lactone acylase